MRFNDNDTTSDTTIIEVVELDEDRADFEVESINVKLIDDDTVFIEGSTPFDVSDAHCTQAYWIDGDELTEAELVLLNEDTEYVQEMADISWQ
jgi:hypothetical protein